MCSVALIVVLLSAVVEVHTLSEFNKPFLVGRNISDAHNVSDFPTLSRTHAPKSVYDIPKTGQIVGAKNNSSDKQQKPWSSDYVGVTVIVAVAVFVLITIGCFVWYKRTTGSCYPSSNHSTRPAPSYH